MKTTALLLTILLLIACGKSKKNNSSTELITSAAKQDSVFKTLIAVTRNTIPENIHQDSLAFLVLPVQASCPSCRKKTIDSIIKHQNTLAPNHFIILAADGGRKTITSYFREEDSELPDIKDRLFLDSTNETHKYDLYADKPTIYYTYNRKAYKKIAAIPATVREDLREFFSGHRNDNH